MTGHGTRPAGSNIGEPQIIMQTPIHYGDGVQAICKNLRNSILKGTLEPGRKLKIQALAEGYGTSIIPVREALRTLAAEGLVVIRPRKSPLVAKPDIDEVMEINEIRRALEPRTLFHAVSLHTQTSLARCKQILERDRACVQTWRRVELNRQFHIELLAPSGRIRTLQVIKEQYGPICLFAHLQVVQDKVMEGEAVQEHEAILEAVARRDTSEAIRLLDRHLALAAKRIVVIARQSERNPA